MSTDAELLKRALERERTARKEAERLLTDKSQELFTANERLRLVNEELERTVQERTEAVRKAEQRWRFALTGTGDGVWELDVRDWSVFYSSGFKRMLGFEENEMPMTYDAWRSRAHPDDLPRIFRIFEQYVAGEIVTHHIEYRVMHRDGGYRWMLDRGMVLEYDASGATRRIIGTHTDIHHLKTVELELERSNDRLATLIANMQTSILVEDPQRRILLTNRSFCQMFGIPAEPEQMVGFDCAAAAEQTAALFVGPDRFITRIDAILKAREVVINERLEMADGRVLERTFIPVEHRGEYLGHLWKYVDVTARVKAEETLRRREEKYRSIIANMNLGLIEVDLEERIRYVNQSFLQMSGYTTDELIGKVASELFLAPEERSQMEERNRSRSEGVSSAYEIRARDRKGEDHWWLVSGAPLYDDRGRLQGSIGIHLDITERKGLEEQLLRAKSIAEKNAQAKEVFLAHMSHEIRTPMNAIMGLGRELAHSELSATQRMHVDAINTASDNLLVIINNILDSSKMEAGKLVLQRTGFNVADTMKQVERVLAHRAKQKGLSFATNVDPTLPPVLLGDPYRLNQVLFNITGNAVKFTEQGSVVVNASTFVAQGDAHWLSIKVADTGPGMSQSFIERMFDPYSQERNSSGGTGLGMSISKQLVELMGGRIEVASVPGVGTTFNLILPFGVGTATDLLARPGEVEARRSLHGLRVLLVEDNDMNRLVATTILERQGIQVTEAYDGRKALDAMRGHRFDLVLMDVHMPVMDGLTATRAVRNDMRSDIPVIALTANALKGDMEKCLDAGMNAVLTKPFQEAELLDLIARFAPQGRPEGPLVDLSKLQDIARGDQAFVRRMIDLFIEQAPKTIDEMQRALAANEPLLVGDLAHRLKSSVDSLGARTLHELVRSIESAGRSMVSVDELREPVQRLTVELERVLGELQRGRSPRG